MKSSTRMYLSNHKGIMIHVSEDELELYHSLSKEQKRLLRAVVKALIMNPELLNVEFLQKFLTAKVLSDYVCPLCLIPFSTMLSLKMHIRYSEHNTKCLLCKKSFQDSEATLDHICKKHNICMR
jgi:hypothetical protein